MVAGESVADTSASSPDMAGPSSPCKLEMARSSPSPGTHRDRYPFILLFVAYHLCVLYYLFTRYCIAQCLITTNKLNVIDDVKKIVV